MVVNYSDAFKRQLKRLSRRYRLIRDDIQPVIDQLAAGQTPGDRIQGVADALYKVRVRNTSAGRGKSGGYRVIYYLRTTTDVLLVTIYSKADQSDIDFEALARFLQQEER